MAAGADEPAPTAAGDSEGLGADEVLGAAGADGSCEGVGWLDPGTAGDRVADGWAAGDDGVDVDADGARVGVAAGDGVLVGVAAREGDGSSVGDRNEVGDGVIVEAGTTTAGEAGTSGGRTNR